MFLFLFFCILQRFRQAVRYGSVTQAHAPLEYILDLNGGYGRSSSRNGHRLSHEHLLVEQPQPPQVWFQAFLFSSAFFNKRVSQSCYYIIFNININIFCRMCMRTAWGLGFWSVSKTAYKTVFIHFKRVAVLGLVVEDVVVV